MSLFSRCATAAGCELAALGLGLGAGLAAGVVLHAAASLAVVVLLLPLLPGVAPGRARAAWLFCFALNFFLPLAGLVALIATAAMARLRAARARPQFELHASPAYDPRAELPTVRSRGGVRIRLADASVPIEARLRALLTVQSMPARMANPLIREMLSDPAEDLRLVAYGILDGREKTINALIHAAGRRLNEAPGDERAALEKRLAELYCELIYQGLVQGGLREHAAQEARAHLERALAAAPADPALHALAGQIALSRGEHEAAERALRHALALGLPASRALPYLAEAAFRTRRFDQVRSLARQLAALPGTQRIAPVVEYWTAAAK